MVSISESGLLGQRQQAQPGRDRFGNDVTLTDTVWDTDAGELVRANGTSATLEAGGSPMSGGFVRAAQGAFFGLATVNVLDTPDPPVIAGTIPDQRWTEDGGAWLLDLGLHATDVQDPPSDLRWFVKGDHGYLFHVEGEKTWGRHVLKQDGP